jgi:hypothetical protein
VQLKIVSRNFITEIRAGGVRSTGKVVREALKRTKEKRKIGKLLNR